MVTSCRAAGRTGSCRTSDSAGPALGASVPLPRPGELSARVVSTLVVASSQFPVSVTRGTTTEGCVDQGKLAAWTRMRVYPC